MNQRNDDHENDTQETHHRRRAAFGNSTGDRQMLESTKTGDGARNN